MTMRKWHSNNLTFRANILEKLLETADLPSPLTSSKTLGMHWDIARDNLHVSTPTTESSVAITKRLVASLSAKVYDALELLSPVTIISKILLQELWKLQLHWESEIPDDLATQWRQWIGDLQLILNHPIPRRLTTNSSPVVFQALHGFCDASTVVYGAVVYLRIMYQDTSVSMMLITSKATVAPLNSTTISRLELVAAYLLAAKLLQNITKLFDMATGQIFGWTDTEIVLCWLKKAPSSLNNFVSHRVAAIQDIIPANHWHHVPTKENPADLLSCSMRPNQLVKSSLW